MHRTPGFRCLVISIGESINPNQSRATVFLLIYQSIALHILHTFRHRGITRSQRVIVFHICIRFAIDDKLLIPQPHLSVLNIVRQTFWRTGHPHGNILSTINPALPPIPSHIKEIDSIIALIFPFDPIFIDRFDLLLVVATTARKDQCRKRRNSTDKLFHRH